MTVKRRVIWLTDEEWAAAEREGKAFGMNRSRFIGGILGYIGDGRIVINRLVSPDYTPVPK